MVFFSIFYSCMYTWKLAAISFILHVHLLLCYCLTFFYCSLLWSIVHIHSFGVLESKHKYMITIAREREKVTLCQLPFQKYLIIGC
jgi:hypothetical protein